MLDAAFALQQIDGWQRGRLKLPTLAAIPDWHWPVRLSLEQCSSEETARYKAHLLKQLIADSGTSPDDWVGVDLTGGLGVDTFFLSQSLSLWHYVERNTELAQVAAHNFEAASRTNIRVHNLEAEAFLSTCASGHSDAPLFPPGKKRCIFLDPARRSESGSKVFRLQDCTPDLTQLYSQLLSLADFVLLKLSPMLDSMEVLRHLPDASEVHVVSTKGEVKELLVVLKKSPLGTSAPLPHILFTAAMLPGTERFTFSPIEEQTAEPLLMSEDGIPSYIYEPDAAVLKAGAFKVIATRFNVQKMAVNTHLYASDRHIPAFPGRVFRVLQVLDKAAQKALKGTYANILTRNYPIKPDELRKKLQTRDGGDHFIIGARVANKPLLFLCERIMAVPNV